MTSQQRSRRPSTRKPGAPPMTQWLDFIRPFLDRYARLGRGEQKKFIQALANEMDKSVNTLRRFIWAAQFLESHGITYFASGVEQMPLNAVEFVMRIAKRDPEHAKRMLDALRKGTVSVGKLKSEFAATSDRRAAAEPTADRIGEKQLRAIIAKLAARPRKPVAASGITLREFELWNTPDVLFDRLAHPVAIAELRDGRKAVIFDEGAVAWSVSPDRATREFLRNIAVAETLYDFVIVFCSNMENDVVRLRSVMRAECRRRISVRIGVLESWTDKALLSLVT